MPDIMAIARQMQGKDPTKELSIATEDRDFRDIFGVGPMVALVSWKLLEEYDLTPEKGTIRHFMWSLLFLKGNATEARNKINCGGADKKTMRKWIWQFVSAIADLEPYLVRRSAHSLLTRPSVLRLLTMSPSFLAVKIVWANRFIGDVSADCLVDVDGTDFKIAEHGPEFSSHKYAKKSALRYEVATCIQTGRIVWVNGPFEAGMWPDISIFRCALKSMLAANE